MIKSLQGLRTLSMIGIFLFHAGLLINGTFPVIFFFILSGFVLYWSYSSSVIEVNISKIISWVKNRMKKMYPIHVITFVMSIFIRYDWIMKLSKIEIIINTVLNLSLLQTLVPKYAYSFNGLSWFLSVTMILYVLALPLIYLINKIKLVKVQYIIIILLLKYLISLINNYYNLGLDLYTSPFYRILDFILGMLIANMLINNKEYDNKKNTRYTVYEIIIFVSFFIIYISTFFIKVEGTAYSIIFTILIYVVAQEKGSISKLLKSSILQKLASISFEFYMVHELILIAFRRVFEGLNFYWVINNFIVSIPTFIISLCIAKLLNKYITNKKLNKNVFVINIE